MCIRDRSRGKKPQGDVISLRRQLRDALAAGDEPSQVKISDMSAEMDLCQEKYSELMDLSEGLQSAAPTSRAKQRVRQRLTHLAMRIQNLEAQALGPEMETILKDLRGQVGAALQGPSKTQQVPTNLNPPLSTLVEEKEPVLAAPPVAFSGMAGAFYHKLPNPLAEVVQRLPVVDGLDADKLWQFFKVFSQLADFPGCLLYTSRCV